ncbi:MAG: polyphosphate kinase 1 [Bdellovibrionales bacterium]|nr:polyphosphate kinase 1 [Bdellovibrionales bacterium]
MSDKIKKIKSTDPLFLNREIQWLQFNQRVLNEARDPRTPLLERLNFLSIFTSNLDEFVMKRVGGLKRQMDFGLPGTSIDGLSPEEQLKRLQKEIQSQVEEQSKIYKSLLPEMVKHGIQLKKWRDLNATEKAFVRDYYTNNVFPVLTPLVVDPALPFPFISNLTLSLAVSLKTPDSEDTLFARVKVPEVFPQWIQIAVPENKNKYVFISLVQIIQYNLHDLFPDTQVLDVMPFRITRNADLERDEEDAEDLLELISEEIKQRRFAEAVRLEHGKNSNPWMVQFLKDELELADSDIYQVSGLLDYTSLKPIVALNLPHLKFKFWEPQVPQIIQETSGTIFDTIRRQDILVHFPYESFTASVEKFINEAASDPNTLAIKMTLYRMGDSSNIISALIRAADQGKQVVCIVELKARFDEQRNIYWAQKMEKAGIHVVYGVVGFKTHCKTTLILRKEGSGIAAYANIGTGNYNSVTAKVYTDLSLFTSNRLITDELVQLFHLLTGRSFKRQFNNLLVAPINMKERLIELTRREIEHAENGRPARIIIKCNSLEDKELIELFYEASQKGVFIDLIVRGFCTLRPMTETISEHIRVISVIGRFLEHSRIYFFQNGAEKPIDGDFFISSADLMYRNLNNRLEVACPIFDRKHKRRCWEVLTLALSDYRQAWDMDANGKYVQRMDEDGSADSSSQERFMHLTSMRTELVSDD